MASKKPKAQAALEYLITYGWALIAIATIIGVLITVTSSNVGSNTCHASLAFVCKGVTTQDDTVIMKLQNLTAQTITINPYDDIKFDGQSGYAVVIFQDTEYRFEDVTIGAGQEFIIEGQGQVHADQVTITYYAHETDLTDTETITMNTNAATDTEISNDGLPNSGGLIDCQDAAIGPCEYPVEVTGPDGTAPDYVTAVNPTLTFDSTAIDNLIGSGVTWTVTKAYLYFYVPTDPGSDVYATIEGQPSNKEVVQGWNSVTIENFSGDLDKTLTLGGGFSIKAANSENPPKLIVIVEEEAPPPP